jgi:hypothetical protein
MLARFRRLYGASPLHLALVLTFGALAIYAIWEMYRSNWRILEWFAGSVLGHDLVLFPVVAVADRLLVAVAAWRRRRAGPPLVPWVNHVRAPVVISAVLLGISFPLVLRLAAGTYSYATGLSVHPYLGRWLLLTAVAFIVSAVVFVIRLARAHQVRAKEVVAAEQT